MLFWSPRVHLLETEPSMNPKVSILCLPKSGAFPSVALAFAVALSSASLPALGQSAHSIPPPAASGPQSPFAGTVIEEPIVFVNDQIISKSDYDRQLQELEATARQQNWTPQQLEEQKKNLLRDLVDQQLLLSKGKEMGITGETETIKQLDEIRKQNHLDSMEALEAAAKEQGVSFEDFKQHIRDRIITQQVIGQQVYRKVNITQADLQRYYDAHKSEFDRPESIRLSEILIPTGATPGADDAPQIAAAQSKAQDVYSKLKAGEKFDELAKTTSAGTTAAQGGDLGEFKRGQLAKVLEDQTFSLKPGEYTQPIRTKQGYVILYVAAHTPGGVAPLKDVLPQVEEAVGAQRTEPALREYLKQLRMEAYIDYKPGYADTAAVVNPSKPTYSGYTPPAPKKKKKVERTRFRQRTYGSGPSSSKQQASAPAPSTAPAEAAPPPNVPSLAEAPGAATAATNASGATTAEPTTGQVGAPGTAAEDQVGVANPPGAASPSSTSSSPAAGKNTQIASNATQKPGKKEKIRYGQAPTKTLPSTTATQTVDAGANGASATSPESAQNGVAPETQVAANAGGDAPGIGDTTSAPEKKTRYSDRAKIPKEKKSKVPRVDPFAPQPVGAEEVADRQTQSAPLGLAGDTSKTKKPKPTEKTRLQDQLKNKNGSADSTNAPAAAPDTQATPPATTSAPSVPPATQPQ
jgi:peptidyl-prolyl cis-trans isomerase SurA